jgi:NTE family protein
MFDSYSSIAAFRYNIETVAVLRESFKRWTDEIRKGRCPEGHISTAPAPAGTSSSIRWKSNSMP